MKRTNAYLTKKNEGNNFAQHYYKNVVFLKTLQSKNIHKNEGSNMFIEQTMYETYKRCINNMKNTLIIIEKNSFAQNFSSRYSFRIIPSYKAVNSNFQVQTTYLFN